MIATNLTIAPGADQFVYAKTDFTGADDVRIGFYAPSFANCSLVNRGMSPTLISESLPARCTFA